MNKWRFVAVYVAIALTGAFLLMRSDLSVPSGRPLNDLPLAHNGWRVVSQASFSEKVLDLLKPTDYLSRKYAGRGGEVVELYVGYHNGGRESGEIHSPKQCLPGGGWFKLKEDETSVSSGGRDIRFVKAVYQKGDAREGFLYGYQVKGEPLSSEYSLKFAQVFNSIFHGRRDSAFIRVSVPVDMEEERAFSAGIDFIKDFYPAIEETLPR